MGPPSWAVEDISCPGSAFPAPSPAAVASPAAVVAAAVVAAAAVDDGDAAAAAAAADVGAAVDAGVDAPGLAAVVAFGQAVTISSTSPQSRQVKQPNRSAVR